MLLWEPSKSRVKSSTTLKFLQSVERVTNLSIQDFPALYDWSIWDPERFWDLVWEFCGVVAQEKGSRVIENKSSMMGARFFPEARLNFAENLLKYRDSRPALVFWGEDKVRREFSYAEVFSQVTSLSNALRSFGITVGNVVAGFVPNAPESVISMLAATSIGAAWSSCSPDFGVSGVVDRFGQVNPKILVTSDGYFYRGNWISTLDKVREIVREIPSIKRVIVFSYGEGTIDLTGLPNPSTFHELISEVTVRPLQFESLPFNHPLYIMFSSGTTGKPKCIVHGAGGTLIEHLKELVLHTDLKREDRIFYQTTCGWMMWNWLVSSLAVGAAVILYDGYPFLRDGNVLFDLAEKEEISIFGTNAKFIASLEKASLEPKKSHNLSKIKTILSTGSPLLPEGFDYIYRSVSSDVCLSSIAGGTDIIGCFALGSPMLPVYRSELQTRSLGLKVEVFSESGKSVVKEKGELVCTAPFPSQPVGFWNDSDSSRYKAAYFSRFENVWHHGDYVELTEHGGMIFYGRSDTVLNPGGIRIGTAEIYRQVEKLSEILESIVVGQEWEGDVRVVLFVKLNPGRELTDELKERIRRVIRENASPFHVPKKIISVNDIPRTRSGKITELAVREVIHGREVKNVEALANPESLEEYRGLIQLKEA